MRFDRLSHYLIKHHSVDLPLFILISKEKYSSVAELFLPIGKGVFRGCVPRKIAVTTPFTWRRVHLQEN